MIMKELLNFVVLCQ